jgi:hypothetical protein
MVVGRHCLRLELSLMMMWLDAVACGTPTESRSKPVLGGLTCEPVSISGTASDRNTWVNSSSALLLRCELYKFLSVLGSNFRASQERCNANDFLVQCWCPD